MELNMHVSLRYGRAAGLAFLVLLASGCSVIGLGSSDRSRDRGGNCEADPSACAYGPGEREYAEKEAARLNKESAAKLRRGSRR
jgi:hypothetical protein